MKKITIAVIGCGRIANNAHFPAFEKIENLRIKYACDILPEKAERAKETFPKIEQVIPKGAAFPPNSMSQAF